MNIAFYAPLKSPDSQVPSGDRLIGRMLRSALLAGGHTVEAISCFRSFDRSGDSRRQSRIEKIGRWHATRIARRLRRRRPHLWFTYHLYHKAPDWIGPAVVEDLGIPYCIAEASLSSKQADGRWARGHRATQTALAQADLVINLNPKDEAGIKPALKPAGQSIGLRPFIDGTVFRAAHGNRRFHRAQAARCLDLDTAAPWMIAVGMMRSGDKEASYRLLAEALGQVADRLWQLILVGDGPARPDIESAMGTIAGRVRYAGQRDTAGIAALMAASDILVWPAVNEALGMVFIEAAASGLPVVAANRPGIASIVTDGTTGLLVPEHDAARFASAARRLLDDPALRQQFGAAAFTKARFEHDIITQGPLLCQAVEALVR